MSSRLAWGSEVPRICIVHILLLQKITANIYLFSLQQRITAKRLQQVAVMFCRRAVLCFYEGRTESHEQLFFACELGTADEGEYGGRCNPLLCFP